MRVVVYGSSDDRIEIAGDRSEEFYVDLDDTIYVGLSNGVLLKVTLRDVWEVRTVRGYADIYPARDDDSGDDEDGCPDYSDKAVINSPIEWVLVGTDLVK